MRAPNRRRPQLRSRATPPVGADLQALADSAKYVWSAEHKDHLSPAGMPRLRTDATPCPKDIAGDGHQVVVARSHLGGRRWRPLGEQDLPTTRMEKSRRRCL